MCRQYRHLPHQTYWSSDFIHWLAIFERPAGSNCSRQMVSFNLSWIISLWVNMRYHLRYQFHSRGCEIRSRLQIALNRVLNADGRGYKRFCKRVSEFLRWM